MRRALPIVSLCLLGFAAGVAAMLLFRHRDRLPDSAAVATQIREVARLETLEVTLYKKISFAPEPSPGDSLWSDLGHWLQYSLNKPEGRAIVFARARIGLDLQKLDASKVRIAGDRVELSLPPLSPTVEVLPGETEIIGSNLDSAETAQLFQRAKEGFERQVERDAALRERARSSAQRALRGLLLTLGFREVRFEEEGVTSST
jgi:hypothetical protein